MPCQYPLRRPPSSRHCRHIPSQTTCRCSARTCLRGPRPTWMLHWTSSRSLSTSGLRRRPGRQGTRARAAHCRPAPERAPRSGHRRSSHSDHRSQFIAARRVSWTRARVGASPPTSFPRPSDRDPAKPRHLAQPTPRQCPGPLLLEQSLTNLHPRPLSPRPQSTTRPCPTTTSRTRASVAHGGVTTQTDTGRSGRVSSGRTIPRPTFQQSHAVRRGTTRTDPQRSRRGHRIRSILISRTTAPTLERGYTGSSRSKGQSSYPGSAIPYLTPVRAHGPRVPSSPRALASLQP